ncbi:MAG: hypothetical protein U9Q03_03700 [Patescibacteria group bacterium]|nr:hypothetical protein [Patescibacteria group bacterium]
MRHLAILMTVALLAGCASFASGLREAPRQPDRYATPATVDGDTSGSPENPSYPSPLTSCGVELAHNGYWRLLDEHDIIPLPDDRGVMSSYLVRDCEPDVPGDDLTYGQCRSRIMIIPTGGESPTEVLHAMYGMVEDVDFLSDFGCVEGVGPDAAWFSYRDSGMRGLAWGILTDADDEHSGVIAVGEWPSHGRNLMESQFSEIVRSMRVIDHETCLLTDVEMERIDE